MENNKKTAKEKYKTEQFFKRVAKKFYVINNGDWIYRVRNAYGLNLNCEIDNELIASVGKLEKWQDTDVSPEVLKNAVAKQTYWSAEESLKAKIRDAMIAKKEREAEEDARDEWEREHYFHLW